MIYIIGPNPTSLNFEENWQFNKTKELIASYEQVYKARVVYPMQPQTETA